MKEDEGMSVWVRGPGVRGTGVQGYEGTGVRGSWVLGYWKKKCYQLKETSNLTYLTVNINHFFVFSLFLNFFFSLKKTKQYQF